MEWGRQRRWEDGNAYDSKIYVGLAFELWAWLPASVYTCSITKRFIHLPLVYIATTCAPLDAPFSWKRRRIHNQIPPFPPPS